MITVILTRTPASTRRRNSCYSSTKRLINEEENESLEEDQQEFQFPVFPTSISAEEFLAINSPKPLAPETSKCKLEESPQQQIVEETQVKITVKHATVSKTATKPVSPNLRIEKRFKVDQLCSDPVLTTEELLVKRLEEERQAEKQKIEKRKKLYEKLKANGFQSVTEPKRQEPKKLTVPKTPNSILDKKLGKRVPSVLRKSPPKEEKKQKLDHHHGPTIPIPFSFETDKRLQNHNQLTQDVNAMNSTTSSNGLMKSRSNSESLTAAELAVKFFQDARHYEPSKSNKELKLTEPHSPKLMTSVRSKSFSRAVPLSKEELEAKEMEEIQNKPFKALPLDKRIFESHGELGVPKVSVKPPTIPVDIELRTDKRAFRHSQTLSNDANESFQFKALPLPDFIKGEPERPPSPPAKKHFQPTIPVSPKFHPLHSHSAEAGDEDQYKELRRASSAPARRQKPHHSIIEMQKKLQEDMIKKPAEKSLTKPQEFHFRSDMRGEFRKQQFQEQLLKEQENEMKKREFKALEFNPDKISSHSFTVKPSVKPLTEPEPFHLKSLELHSEAVEEFQQHIVKESEEKLKEEIKHKTFKAKPLPKTTYEPEIIVDLEDKENARNVSMKPLDIVLESDKRAEKRKQFDEQLRQSMLNQELLQKQLLLEKEEEKQKHLQSLRRKTIEEGGLMFKAKPILQNDPFPVKKKPTKDLTHPKSPNLKLKERREMKQSLSNSSTMLSAK